MYVSSASAEADAKTILTATLADALTLVEPINWSAAKVHVRTGTQRMSEDRPPVILVGFQGVPDTFHEDAVLMGAVRFTVTAYAGALFDRGARDVAGYLMAGCRIAFAADNRFMGWQDETMPPSESERTLAESSATLTLKLPAGPPRGRRIPSVARVTEATITVEKRP